MGSAEPTSTNEPAWSGILEHCSGVTRAFCLDYRKASAPPFKSENSLPASIIDALSGYRYLIENIGFAPQDIIVAGVSSGAHLAIVFIRYLFLEKIPSLPLPKVLILLSPSVDWGLTHDDLPSSSMIRNSQTDCVRIMFQSGYTARAIFGSLPHDEIRTNPWFSPASLEIPNSSGIFSGFPPTWILAGSLEQSVDPMRTLRDRLVNDIGADKVTYVEYPEGTHNLLAYTWQEPERTEALKELRKWIDRVFR
jgi:acetyl esterase/lipase